MRPPKDHNQELQLDLYKVELERIVKKDHALVRLASRIDWKRFEEAFEVCYCPDFGRPGIPTRLLVGLHYLKYTYGLSDEATVGGWLENPYWQYFCGGKFFEHELPLEVSTMSRWRKKIGEAGAEELLAETIACGMRGGVITRRELKRVTVDTTVQTKAIRYPTDSRLYDRMRERLVKCAKERGVRLRQSYRFIGKKVFHRQSKYARAMQYKRARKEMRKLKTYLRRVVRDIGRKAKQIDEELKELLERAERLLRQERKDKNKLYSVHAPEVECISKGKVHKRYEFGCKVGLATTARTSWIVGVKAFQGNPYDGHTLSASIEQTERLTKTKLEQVICDLGYRGHTYGGECTIEIVPRYKKAKSKWKKYWWNRRSAIEPVIGHMKEEHRLERNRLKGEEGDKLNAILAGCGYNMRKLARAFLRRFWKRIYYQVGVVLQVLCTKTQLGFA
jgi:IS5 family transposase